MSYNPYDSQFYDLVNEIEIKETRIKEIDDIINNHPTLKETLPKEIFNLEKEIINLNNEIKELSLEIRNFNDDIKSDSVLKETVGALGVLGGIALTASNDSFIGKLIGMGISIFSGGVTVHEVKQKQSKKEKVESLTLRLKLLNDNLNGLIKTKIEKSTRLEEIENYNLFEFNKERDFISAGLSKIAVELEKVEKEKIRIDNAIKEQTDILYGLYSEETSVSLDLETAENLKIKLESATNRYERKCIHQESERIFQESNLNKIVINLKKRKRSLDKNIDKVDKEIKEKVKILTTNIDLIIIDGNNLCYKKDKFIGDIALKALVTALLDSEITNKSRILICFDNGISKLLSSTKKDIENNFKSISEKIEVLISNGKADKTIINAAEKSNTFIISNDRFVDFRDKKAIKERRCLRHRMVFNQIHIEEFSIVATYDSNA